MDPHLQQHSVAPLTTGFPWLVSVGRQRDGWIFELEPRTKAAIEERFPGSCRLRSVFIGSRVGDDLLGDAPRLASLFRHVVEMLTELNRDELAELGEMKAVDPTDGALLASSDGPLPLSVDPWLKPRIPLD